MSEIEERMCVLCPSGTDPHPFGDHLYRAAERDQRRLERWAGPVIDRVVDLWNKGNGWIPGAAYKELAEALGISPDRLVHWAGGERHVPPNAEQTINVTQVKPRDYVVMDQMHAAWVRHTEEFHSVIGYNDGSVRRVARYPGLVTIKRGA